MHEYLFNVCSQGCNRSHFARGLCNRCYYRMSKAGRLHEFPLGQVNPGGARERAIGTRRVLSDGYVNIKTERGVEVEHRVVMEKVLGRRLERAETVHHINGIRHDNRPENLEIWYRGQPAGQRVDDLIAYVAIHHAEAVKAALERLASSPVKEEIV